jgi:hypothetical protein
LPANLFGAVRNPFSILPPLPRLLRFATAVVLPVLKLNPVKGLAQEPSAIDKVIADVGIIATWAFQA